MHLQKQINFTFLLWVLVQILDIPVYIIRRQRKGPGAMFFFSTREKGTPNKSTLKVEKGKTAIAGSQGMLLALKGQDAGEGKGEQKET